MTQSIKDKLMRSLVRGSETVRLFVIAALFAVSATATAEVTLENSVQKVETFVNESGELERRLVDADSVVPGDELRYTIRFSNEGTEVVDASSIVITNPIPEKTCFIRPARRCSRRPALGCCSRQKEVGVAPTAKYVDRLGPKM